MKVAHFDCFSGISGDMVLGAVIDAGVPETAIRAALDSLQLPIELEMESVKRCGFRATKATIHARDEQDYRFLPDVEAILTRGALSPLQRDLASAIFRKLAHAEATAHGMPLEKVHFHEVGALDSIADIVGSAVGLNLLGVDRFTSSPVAVGSGTVKCAHGIMPIPTPGTAELLKGVPIAPCPVKGELTTPTGAAILTTVVSEFCVTPAMTVQSIGHGAGTKDPIEQPNLLRLMIGTDESTASGYETDTIAVLESNLDDVTPELIGFCTERLFAAGALDVFVVHGQMKKGRPGFQVSILCEPAKVPDLEQILFRESGTLGIRRTSATRSKLHREAVTVATPWGPVRAKKAWARSLEFVAPEYEECARIAREQSLPLAEVYRVIRQIPGSG